MATRRPPARAADGPASDADEADPEAVARLICLRMLTAAPRTRAQLASALRRRGVPEAAAEAVLGRFTEVKLIDDATFASAWVESRHHGRGLSGRRRCFICFFAASCETVYWLGRFARTPPG